MRFVKIWNSSVMAFYKLVPKQIGCEVIGIDLNTENRPKVIEQIKKDVTEHRLLFFTNQGVISGDRHVEISKWFGELDSVFYKHPKSPHPDVFRVSNDESEGCTNVGTTGWHIDGTFQPAPFAYSIYHMPSVPTDGATVFLPLTEFLESLAPEKRAKLDRLWMMSDRRDGPVHPFIYRHPKTQKPVLCLHLGMTKRFIWDYKTDKERVASKQETAEIIQDIHEEITVKNKHLQYKHEWQPGDFIISDNVAVSHEAAPETQYPRSKVGLRVLHRTTIKGPVPPQK